MSYTLTAAGEAHEDPIAELTDDEQPPELHQVVPIAADSSETFEAALTAFIEPFTGVGGAAPTMSDVHLLPSASFNSAAGELEGVVATLSGEARVAPLTDSLLLGGGTTWVRVTGRDGAPIDEEAVVSEFAPMSGEHADMRVALVSGLEYPARAHYVVVEGNDRAAAERLATRAREATVDDLIKGPLKKDYDALINESYARRTAAAAEFMRAHELEQDTRVETGNQRTHYIDFAHALSRPSTSSKQRAANTYVLYLGAVDPSQAHSGVMVYRGPIAGYTHLAAATARGKSAGWSNEGKRGFSMFPATTGEHAGGKSSRAAGRHKHSSERVRAAHAERVRWSGAVATYNPRADTVYHASNDALWIEGLSELGAPPGGAISSAELDTVVVSVPGVSTEAMRLGELAHVLAHSEESALTVSTRATLRWLAAWPAAPSRDLAALFSSRSADGATLTLARDVIEDLHAALGDFE